MKKIISGIVFSTFLAGVAMSPLQSVFAQTEKINLVPDEAVQDTPSYVCTWTYQDWEAPRLTQEKGGTYTPRDTLNDEVLFGEDGWANTLYPDVRKDLYYLLDDGWELPYDGGSVNPDPYFGSQDVSLTKFPGYGDTPQDRLKTLVDKVKAAGWKGAGIWICAEEDDQNRGMGWNEPYWRERLEWSKYAGVSYWKVDWGNHEKDQGWREMLMNLADEIYPTLVVENATVRGAMNNENGSYRMDADTLAGDALTSSYSDVFRTYDVTGNLSIATTLDRVGENLFATQTNGKELGLMNGEDEVYACASLGLIFGAMRYPVGNESAGSLPNIYFGGGDNAFTQTRPIRKMIDEVERAAKWERIAPAYRIDAYETKLSDEYLADDWYFQPGDSWAASNRLVTQRAPAVIARGLDLPEVTVASGDKPFVFASRNPDGAISVGTYGRTHQNVGYQKVKADVALNAGDLTGKIGVFGYYNSLTLNFNQSLEGKTVLAQDLMADSAQDITSRVSVSGNSITFPGNLLEEVGLSGATPGDASEPGMVIQIGDAKDFLPAPPVNTASKQLWDIQNDSFEKVNYDAGGQQYGEDNTKIQPSLWKVNNLSGGNNSYVVSGGHSGGYCCTQTSSQPFEVSTCQVKNNIPNGVYKASVWVKSSEHTLAGSPSSAAFTAKDFGSNSVSMDIQKMTADNGKLEEWTKLELPEFTVTNNQLTIELYSKGAANEYLLFDDVEVTPVKQETTRLVSDIQLDGNSLQNFSFMNENYTYSVLHTQDAKVPDVTVKTRDDAVAVEVRKPASIPGEVVVTAREGEDTETYRVYLDYTNAAYAGDMAWKSSTVGWSTIKLDKSLNNNPLQLKTANASPQKFDKGIGTHAISSIVIDVAGKGYARFQAYVGVDAEANSAASITFEVLVDGVSKFNSGVMGKNDLAKQVDVDITGASEITLNVGDSGNGNRDDHADWADAKFILAANAPAVNKEALRNLVNECEALDMDLYEDNSDKAAFLEQIAGANQVLGSGEATQSEVDDAYAALTGARASLRLKTVITDNTTTTVTESNGQTTGTTTGSQTTGTPSGTRTTGTVSGGQTTGFSSGAQTAGTVSGGQTAGTSETGKSQGTDKTNASTPPKTGDTRPYPLYVLVLAAGALAAVVSGRKTAK